MTLRNPPARPAPARCFQGGQRTFDAKPGLENHDADGEQMAVSEGRLCQVAPARVLWSMQRVRNMDLSSVPIKAMKLMFKLHLTVDVRVYISSHQKTTTDSEEKQHWRPKKTQGKHAPRWTSRSTPMSISPATTPILWRSRAVASPTPGPADRTPPSKAPKAAKCS